MPSCTPTGLSLAAMPSTRASPAGRVVRRLGVHQPQALSLASCGSLWSERSLTWVNGWGSVPSDLAAFTVIPRCSPADLVRLWCAHPPSPLRPYLPLLRPVALHQRSDPCGIRLAVQLGHEIVRAKLVEISPPSTSSVVPDPVSTWHTPGYVASPTHSPPVPGIVPALLPYARAGTMTSWLT